MASSNNVSSKIKKHGKNGEVNRFSRLLNYFLDSRLELRKVTWPTRKETIMTSLAVFVLVLVVSVFLGIVDFGISSLVGYLLSL
ncbi:MAG: preprotein translocase subunit SecE [Desulfovibrionaceae bacterium]